MYPAPLVIGTELFSGKPFSRLDLPLAKVRSYAGIGATNAADRGSDDEGICITENDTGTPFTRHNSKSPAKPCIYICEPNVSSVWRPRARPERGWRVRYALGKKIMANSQNYSLEEMDRHSLFHPATSIADHLKSGPTIIAGGSGVR